MLSVVALVAGAALVAVLVIGRSSTDYRLNVVLTNASQLVKGNRVSVGGVPVGTVSDISLDDRNRAVVALKITDPELAPLHEGTRAVVRATSLAPTRSTRPGRSSKSRRPTAASSASVSGFGVGGGATERHRRRGGRPKRPGDPPIGGYAGRFGQSPHPLLSPPFGGAATDQPSDTKQGAPGAPGGTAR
jgi:hypothetical protein